MRHIPIQFTSSSNTHVAEEVMLGLKGVIRGRVLCGGLRSKNIYEHEIGDYLHRNKMSREKWFTAPKRIAEKITCKKCSERHHRFMDEYEQDNSKTSARGGRVRPSQPLKIFLRAEECVINRAGVCIRLDDSHVRATIDKGKDYWWSCPTHP